MLVAALAVAVLNATPTLAVAPFAVSDAALEPVGRGFAETLLTDLSALSNLQLVERSRLKLVLEELALWRTPLVDPTTAVKVGQRLAADYLLLGSLRQHGALLGVTARVVAVKSGKVIASRTVEGTNDQLFALEKDVAEFLVESLAVKLSVHERGQLRKAHGTSYDDFVAAGRAIDAMYRGDLAEGKRQFDAAKGNLLYRALALSERHSKEALQRPITDEEELEFHAILRSLDPGWEEAGATVAYLLGLIIVGAFDDRRARLHLELCEWLFDLEVALMDSSSGLTSVETKALGFVLAFYERDGELRPLLLAGHEYLLRKYPTDPMASDPKGWTFGVADGYVMGGYREQRARAKRLLERIDALVERKWEEK